MEERGQYLIYFSHKKLHKFLSDIDLRGTLCMALHPENLTVLCTSRDGQSSWSGGGGVPKAVDKALRTRIGEHRSPTAIALGTEGRYFMQFANGKELWYGSQNFKAEIASNYGVKMVAFGEHFNSYFVFYEDGSAEWCNLPTTMHKFLKGRRKNLPGIDFVSVGKLGTYFIRFEDGSWRSAGFSTAENSLVKETKTQGDIREIYFVNCGYGYSVQLGHELRERRQCFAQIEL